MGGKSVNLQRPSNVFWTTYVPLGAFIIGEDFVVKAIKLFAHHIGLGLYGSFTLLWVLFVTGGILLGMFEYKATDVGQNFVDPIGRLSLWLVSRPSFFGVLGYLASACTIGALTVPAIKSADLPHKLSLAMLVSIMYACVWVPFLWLPIPGLAV